MSFFWSQGERRRWRNESKERSDLDLLFSQAGFIRVARDNRELCEANERLFHAALQLTRAYICNSREFFQNLKNLKFFLDNQVQPETLEQEMPAALEEAFFSLSVLIPALCVNFESVGYAFRSFSSRNIGTVIINKAHKEPPHTAMGLLSRASRCVVIGSSDPYWDHGYRSRNLLDIPGPLLKAAYYASVPLEENPEYRFSGEHVNLHKLLKVSLESLAGACVPYKAADRAGFPIVDGWEPVQPVY